MKIQYLIVIIAAFTLLAAVGLNLPFVVRFILGSFFLGALFALGRTNKEENNY